MGPRAHQLISRGMTRAAGVAAVPFLPWLARRAGFRSLAAGLLCAEEAVPSDLIHVLGGGSTSPTLRIDHGVDLWRRGFAPRIFLTGSEFGVDWAAKNARRAHERGVPPEALIAESAPPDTWAEARALRRLVRERSIRSVILVTEAFHSGRAKQVFARSLRGDPVSLLSCPAASAGYPPARWWEDPLLRSLVLGEWLRLAVGRAMGTS